MTCQVFPSNRLLFRYGRVVVVLGSDYRVVTVRKYRIEATVCVIFVLLRETRAVFRYRATNTDASYARGACRILPPSLLFLKGKSRVKNNPKGWIIGALEGKG